MTYTKGKKIIYYPKENLPYTTKDRIGKLFEAQQTWRAEEFMPYIESLINVNPIETVTKYCNESHMEDGSRIFMPKVTY